MPKITIIVWLTDAARNGSPVMFVRGRSGLEHRYVWNTKHEKHILDNKEFTPEEWNKEAVEIQGGRQESFFRPVVKVIVTEEVAASDETAPSSPDSRQVTSEAEDRSHNPEAAGSSPAPAPSSKPAGRKRGPDKKKRRKSAKKAKAVPDPAVV